MAAIDTSNSNSKTFSVFSWNVNRYDDNVHSILSKYISKNNPSIVFLSETKRYQADLAGYFSQFKDYNYIINQHVPFQYHGVAMLIRKEYQQCYQLDVEFKIPSRKDTKCEDPTKGRIISVVIKDIYEKPLYIVGSYSPNSGVKGLKNLSYRIDQWDYELFSLMNDYSVNGNYAMLIGDLNVAPEPIDVSNPEYMYKWPGYTVEERNNFYLFLLDGWFDVWRDKNPDKRKYTWVGSSRTKRENYGMRLDNIVCNKVLSKLVKDVDILSHINGSDHVPITGGFTF
jgi:exodeoxyribonuclease-3